MTTKIIVNGEEHEIDGDIVTYDKAVELATGKTAPGYTVYFRGSANPNKQEGALAQGEKVQARHAMELTVSFTDTAQSQ